MHIKTLKIQGFKSYRDQTAVEEFSRGHNVVVGRNGSGKSNFFAAIRFVLSDAYNFMSREDRQALLHDSSASSSATLSAFVEIVFDNSDGRFPHGSGSDLVLRRTIGLKKDEYSLDKKSVTKQDVLNMLEAAGFSRANPYYIVPQGRITHLTNMKDSDRLNLLKDVAGTKVYETKRADSLRIMDETNGKKEKIQELLDYIDARLLELDEERNELKEYHEKDKERRCLEYALFYKQQQDALGHQEDLNLKKNQEAIRIEEATKRFNEREVLLERLEESLATLKQEASMLMAERDALVQDRRELTRTRATLESAVNDEEERSEQTLESRAELEAKAKEVDADIVKAEDELRSLASLLDDKTKDLAQARAALEDVVTKCSVLLAKQARSNQFTSKAQRDSALREELRSLESYEASQADRQRDLQQELNETEARVGEIETSLSQKTFSVEEGKVSILRNAQTWAELKNEEDQLVEKRKVLWREEQKLKGSNSLAKDKFDEARKKLDTTMDRGTANGLRAVEEITQRLGLHGVYGPLYKLFTVEDRYKQAVEATAGQSLFHVVVDTDETASTLLEIMTKEKSGRVTFAPLNRIKPKVVSFQEKSDALLMITKVSFDRKYEKAMQQVFARTIICESLTVAASYVKSHDVNGITLEGDRVERKGALTGGSHDAKKSRLDLASAVSRWQEVYTSELTRLQELEQNLADLDQRVTALASQRQLLENQSRQIKNSRNAVLEEMRLLEEAKSSCIKRIENLRRDLNQLSSEMSACSLKKTALREEIITPLSAGLSSNEQTELKDLTAMVDAQEKQVAGKVASVQELSNQRELLEIELNGNLKKQREQIAVHLESVDDGGNFSQEAIQMGRTSTQSIAAYKKQLSSIKKQLVERQKSLDRTENRIEELQVKINEEQEKVDQTIREQADEGRAIEKRDKVITQTLAKIRSCTKQREEAEQKIRELGVVPGEAYHKHVASSADVIMKAMHKINSALKKFTNVNKRAVEQYDNFTRQRDQLISRQADLETSSESIQELIETLDYRKDEAIERTFKQVSKNFAEIFEKLVPMGKGKLVMQMKFDAAVAEDEDQDEEDAMEVDGESRPSKSNIENYTGVSIKVSFHSKVDEGLRIQQLSGGQKALVALAIVFAIQKCDPAAFYLFDEIDANLDAQYRTAVAAMIKELSADAQFITTTFRPELVGVGEKHYGVLFNAQKVSTLQPITQDDAYQFVEASSQPS